MANQYSITVSDESDRILKQLKEHRVKTSQAIDEAIKTLGKEAILRLVAQRRTITTLRSEVEEWITLYYPVTAIIAELLMASLTILILIAN